MVLEGASFFNEVKVKDAQAAVSPEEKTRVKALGFLFDKRIAGPVQRPESSPATARSPPRKARPSREAAERFGSGEVAMTVPPDGGDSGRALRQHRAPARISGAGRTGDRRHRLQGAPDRLLQGYHLPVRADRHLRPLGGNPRAVLSRLPRGQAARTSSRSPSAAVRTTASSPI